jgi:formiminotetrahydrofolate cyclodeaminase
VRHSLLSLADLLDAFASSDPVPGGGSASALAGALGASLLLMVAGMPKTRTGAPEETSDLAAASARLRPLRDTLVDLVDRDSEAYEAVVAAFRRPKGTEAEKNARREAIRAATRGATDVPLETMRACQQALRGAVIVARGGNPNAKSDVGVAVGLLLAGLRGARLNVEINLGSLGEPEYAARIRGECEVLERDAADDAARAQDALEA